ncbi:LOW QUALITY PROTEIN: hypothetical protein Cgig2_003411 [Carnegiea gigantea]|uniref:Cytochrome P450 n=1 Tax=Carnegiea gigantea TaxID=171969 RepID=A0A9Q1QEC0_9CARY|nr:LOW QUALITY PROTEIN: hypothetical protein Cgig2_003411 [Carnegiea gigantea]
MLLLLLLVVVFSLSFLIILPNYRKKHEKLNLPRGPKGLPLLGNLHQFDSLAPHLFFSRLAKIYGPILSLQFGCRSAVVLKTQDHNFCTRPSLVAQQRLTYNGLDIVFSPYNEPPSRLSSAPIRQEEVSRMIQKIAFLSSASKVVNLSNLLMALTSSIICRVAFGKRYQDEGVERSRFHEHLNEVQAKVAAPFCTDYFPFEAGLIDKLTGLSSSLEKAFKKMDEFYDEMINDHLDPNRPKDDNHEDVIDVLLQLRQDRCFSFELTLDRLKAVLMVISTFCSYLPSINDNT